jgi:hypothetical protein
MIVFQDAPDAIFLAIVDEALAHVREVHLLHYRTGYRPTRAERRELEDSYRDLFPELVPLFTRRELVRVIDRLRRANRDEGRRYELTDYHRLALYACLQVYCDLHNDGAAGDEVGPYEIEHIDFDAVVERVLLRHRLPDGGDLAGRRRSRAWPAQRDAAGLENRRGAEAGGEGSAAEDGQALRREHARFGGRASHPCARLRRVVSPSRTRGGRGRGPVVTRKAREWRGRPTVASAAGC